MPSFTSPWLHFRSFTDVHSCPARFYVRGFNGAVFALTQSQRKLGYKENVFLLFDEKHLQKPPCSEYIFCPSTFLWIPCFLTARKPLKGYFEAVKVTVAVFSPAGCSFRNNCGTLMHKMDISSYKSRKALKKKHIEVQLGSTYEYTF